MRSQQTSTHARHDIDNSKYLSDKYTLEVCEAGGGEGVRFVTKAKCSFPARPRRPN